MTTANKKVLRGVAMLSLCLAITTAKAQSGSSGTETIVVIRHGEKPQPGVGQLNCKGLNRSLALPDVLKRYGRPDAIYAPNPSERIRDGNNAPDTTGYSYVRPLATIEPYAIALDMPVNTQIGFDEIGKLQAELTQPKMANSLIVVAWEHVQAWKFAKQMLTSYGKNPRFPAKWLNIDYDTIYVFHLRHNGNGKPELTLSLDHEGLDNSLPNTCPASPATKQ